MDKTVDILKTEAEIGKLVMEASKLNAETSKLQAETAKLNREARWLPFVQSAVLFGAAAAFAKLFLH
ncbi:TPA: hypothetical protein ACT5B2_003789 [Burkholderia cenocepacia]|uniref:Uncharacterized protein n=1 Tax=Burkholderia cenocepacia TaxID=95486 RepID=A0A1V2W2Z6_9BURK|nr:MULTISPECIES: hypothetical protein [Burkholderia cepacia complex]KVH04091.1 hypothetical protein WS85_29205 [Burkholderia anthina]KVH09900.1 hypothetical protein WS84_17240 [Burkholderia anthina]KVX38948.1 hypothetical protein WT32_07565 [Burkholderia anthina]MBR8248713.1 hypothetical protein [Burkholderia cenocepacia]MBR8288887.1 hypothetical protein [Burkholderia cenocepacia]